LAIASRVFRHSSVVGGGAGAGMGAGSFISGATGMGCFSAWATTGARTSRFPRGVRMPYAPSPRHSAQGEW